MWPPRLSPRAALRLIRVCMFTCTNVPVCVCVGMSVWACVCTYVDEWDQGTGKRHPVCFSFSGSSPLDPACLPWA